MIISAVLGNPEHPEYGVATIPFPIPKKEYAHVMEMLAQLEVGDPLKRDCQLIDIDGWPTVLKRLCGKTINVEELDYLAKRLDSFDVNEAAQYQGTVFEHDLQDMTDLINQTFCCQQATVITDFSNLEEVGKEHYLTLRGGSCPMEDFKQIDGVETAMLLLDSGEGKVTPYGVVYDNLMKMENLYDGIHFPEYYYEPDPLTLEVKDANGDRLNYLYLPMPEQQIERLLHRAGYTSVDVDYAVSEHSLPEKIAALVERQNATLIEVNDMCQGLVMLERQDFAKLDAVMEMARPELVSEVSTLIKNLELFDYIPEVRDAESYGRYMIQESGHFEFDENLESYYTSEAYGRDQMDSESGQFTQHGYVSYHGTLSLDELMAEDPAEQYQRKQGMEMGGMPCFE